MHVLPPLWRENGNHYILQTVGSNEKASGEAAFPPDLGNKAYTSWRAEAES